MIDRDGPWEIPEGDLARCPVDNDGTGEPALTSPPETLTEGPYSEWLWVASDGRYRRAGSEMPAKDHLVTGGLPVRAVPTLMPDGVTRDVPRAMDFVPDDAPEAKVYYKRVEFVRESDPPTEEERRAFALHAAEMLFPKRDEDGG